MLTNEKVKKAIDRLKLFEPEEGYWVGYSGGKDSDAIRILCDLANVKHELHYSHTSVDAPETMKYIKSIPNVHDDIPRYKDGRQKTMWSLIVDHRTPPTRLMRYCCSDLKEAYGKGNLVVTGVRWAESVRRKANQGLVSMPGNTKKKLKIVEAIGAEYQQNKNGSIVLNTENDLSHRAVEQCFRTNKVLLNPIIDWDDEDVWEFLHINRCEGNPLYQCGRKRIGCIGCPMNTNQRAELEQYPKYKAAYIRAFDKMIESRKERGLEVRDAWADGEAVMRWWVGDKK